MPSPRRARACTCTGGRGPAADQRRRGPHERRARLRGARDGGAAHGLLCANDPGVDPEWTAHN